jgi:hypothetical protein
MPCARMDGMAYTTHPTLDRNKDLEMSKEQYEHNETMALRKL